MKMIRIKEHISGLRPSDTLIINQRSIARMNSNLETYRFGFGQSPFPVPMSVQEALRENAHQKDYLPVQGLEQLREAVANHTNQILDSSYKVNEVFIGPGSKELIYLLQMVINAPLIIPSPSWVSYIPQAIMSKKEIFQVDTPLHDWNMQAEKLDKALSKNKIQEGILLLNYPNNPTGRTFTESELASLAEVARKYNLIIISDEIYGNLSFSGEYRSIAKYYPEGTIITSGLSKWCGAGGWRLGTAIFPLNLQHLYSAMTTVASETFSAVSAPIQYAACRAYQASQDLQDYLTASRNILFQVAEYCHQQLILSGIPTHKAEGGFYLFPDFSDALSNLNLNSVNLCEQILEETGVALLPGTAFGRPPSELTVRLSFVDFDGAQALEHYQTKGRIDEAQFELLFPQIVRGMALIREWIKQNSDKNYK